MRDEGWTKAEGKQVSHSNDFERIPGRPLCGYVSSPEERKVSFSRGFSGAKYNK